MDIETAAKELYSLLSQFQEVVGFGICLLNGENAIVIYLSEKNSTISKKIPLTYKKFIVITDITGKIMLQ